MEALSKIRIGMWWFHVYNPGVWVAEAWGYKFRDSLGFMEQDPQSQPHPPYNPKLEQL